MVFGDWERGPRDRPVAGSAGRLTADGLSNWLGERQVNGRVDIVMFFFETRMFDEWRRAVDLVVAKLGAKGARV
jgi:hypothetical protein